MMVRGYEFRSFALSGLKQTLDERTAEMPLPRNAGIRERPRHPPELPAAMKACRTPRSARAAAHLNAGDAGGEQSGVLERSRS